MATVGEAVPDGGKALEPHSEAESSESEAETEPAKAFHRRISTNKEIKCSVCTKEGFLMKQTSSFQRWRRRYFKLKGRKLYYAKDTKSVIFDEIELTDLSVAECSTKNINHSFQCITPFRSLVLGAESRRDMEEWIAALKSATTNQYYEGSDQVHNLLSGQHNWYATSHARPTYCNVCREALSGVTSHGLSCEVCKLKAHKRCAAKALNNCKWTTLASVGKDIIEDDDGLAMPHQWLEGNLPVSAKCAVCEKTCGSVLRLQDWRCLWCRSMVHTACRPLHPTRCPLGPCRVSIVPPTTLTTIGTDESWEAIRPQGCSPLLVFVNSKSGDNQGVRFLRRFKQLLNPAQVFDLMNGGPHLGLRLFKCFDPFRILICSGDGSVGWVLSEIDKLHMVNQCQVGVLPLGTGNDLARVLGWGSACDDDTHLPQILEKYERATTKMLDRWSIMSYVSHVPITPEKMQGLGGSTALLSQVAAYEDSVGTHLSALLQSDQHSTVIASAKVLCETIKSLIMKVGSSWEQCEGASSEDSLASKCAVLNDKLDLLLRALHEESQVSAAAVAQAQQHATNCVTPDESSSSTVEFEGIEEDKKFKEVMNFQSQQRKGRQKQFIERDALMSRANSLKKAVREIIEYTERAVDDQNAQTASRLQPPPPTICLEGPDDNSQVTRNCPQMIPTISLGSDETDSGGVGSPPPNLTPPSCTTFQSSMTTNFPLPPASPLLPHSPASPPTTFLQPPNTLSPPTTPALNPADINCIETLRVKYMAISPLPDVRRSSHTEFEFPPDIPVPGEFADMDSLKDVHLEYKDIPTSVPIKDIEVRIQSSNDNLLDMGDEPYMFEEKSITEIRDSLVNSLNNSIDIEELECEEIWDGEERDKESEVKEDTHDDKSLDESSESEVTLGEKHRTGSRETLKADEERREKEESIESQQEIEEDDNQCINRRYIKREEPTGAESVKVLKPILKKSRSTSRDETKNESFSVVSSFEERDGDSAKSGIMSPPPSSERIVEGAEADVTESEDEDLDEVKGEETSRRISSGSTLKTNVGGISGLGVAGAGPQRDKSRSPERCGGGVTPVPTAGRLTHRRRSSNHRLRKHLPIINPLVSLPMWPNIASGGGSSGGLISKVLLANADALCATAAPLMDIDESSLDGFQERVVMNNYFGIGIDAKITLDFHNKREEHPEKCRSRTKNFMWYVVLASTEWLCKTYKNLDQRVQLECDGERIPLPSLQGIVVLNIPSFMGGTNFWGGTKEDDCFLAPSFDDRILEVVAVFGAAQMGASRIINLQHHRIAQCSNIKITIMGEHGDEGVPIQVDGEAWTQPPGIIRIVHKNRVQMLCRNRDLEVSLKAWEERQRSCGSQAKQPSLITDEELPILQGLATVVSEVISCLKDASKVCSSLENQLLDLAASAAACLEKIYRDGHIIESPNLRMLATELVHNVSALHNEVICMLKEELLVLSGDESSNLQSALNNLDTELKKAHEKDNLVHLVTEEDKKRIPHSRLFKIKLKKGEGRRSGLEKSVREWGPDEVGTWLDDLQLTDYRESFIIHDIRGSELLNLERRDLKELGITKIGHIKRIQQGIREIKDGKT